MSRRKHESKPCGFAGWLGGVILLNLAATAASCGGEVKLPLPREWEQRDIQREMTPRGVELRLVEMIKPAGLVSPPVALEPNQICTLAATVETTYPSKYGYYRFWLELEFLSGNKTLETIRSSSLRGTAPEQVLAVTGVAPAQATHIRVGLWAQNNVSQVLANVARVSAIRLVKLGVSRKGGARVEPISEFPKIAGRRSIPLRVLADWPDGTAVSLETSRGQIVPSVVLTGGQAEATLTYAAEDVGRTTVTAMLAGTPSRFELTDPFAGTITLAGVEADGNATSALLQLVHDGRMLPGRYNAVPGEFVRAPWSQELAPGRYRIRVTRGPQFEPIEREVDLASGTRVSLGHVSLHRGVDLRKLGWYGGDPDGDVYHGEQVYTDVTAETAERIAQAMGLDWVTPANWGKPHPKTWAEARAEIDARSSTDLLFRFGDEKKWPTGHFCFVGLSRPDEESFEDYWHKIERIQPAEALSSLRDHGAATFANHPVRFWMSGVKMDEFITNMYAGMPFDLCAAGLLDGMNINEGGEPVLKLWSLLLDHGYRIAATGGADFSLDHPAGSLPGLTRLYVQAAGGLSERALVAGIKAGRTVVSTGPLLVAAMDDGLAPGSVVRIGQPHRIRVRAWARRDRADRLRRVELYSHGQVLESRELDGREGEATLTWSSSSIKHDWVAVRLVAESGWAMTSAFYAASFDWEPPKPVVSRVAVNVAGLQPTELKGASVEVWNNWPTAPGAKVLRALAVASDGKAATDAPVIATIRLVLADGRHRDVRLYDASGVGEILETISKGAEKEAPLLRWDTYTDVLQRCRNVSVDFRF